MKESNNKQTTRNESRSTSTRASHVNNPEGINQYSDKRSGKSTSHTTSGTGTTKGSNSSSSKSTSTRNSHVNNPEGINQYTKNTGNKTSR